MKAVVDFRGSEALGVIREHLRGRHVLRVKGAFPLRVLET